jgi:hypothetical protein
VDTLSPGVDDGAIGRHGSAAGAYGPIVTETPEGELRASDAEREQVAAELGRAVGEGRLTLAEFSDRAGRAHTARTRAELAPLTADLPAAAQHPTGPPRTSWQVSPIGGMARKGSWQVPERTVGVSLIGGADLDFSDAEFAAPEVTITRWSLIGGIDARVPTGVRVEVSGFSLLGGHRVRLPEPTPGAPVLRLRLFSILGGVSVKPR